MSLDKLSNSIKRHLSLRKRIKGKKGKIPVIIEFHRQPNFNAFIKKYERLKRKKSRRLRIIKAYATEVYTPLIKKLIKEKAVKRIYLNRTLKAHLNKASDSVGARVAHKLGITGKGVTIAFLDSGVHLHPDIKGRVLAFRDLIRFKKKPYDDNGHGTHVAGCAAGNGKMSKGKYRGTAPEANIVSVKVMNRDGFINEANVIAAIQWCIMNKEKYNIRIINLSLGLPKNISSNEDPLCNAVERAVAEGIVVVKSAGNYGPKLNTITSPGNSPLVVTVGSMNDEKADIGKPVADFSSRGTIKRGKYSKPDLVAPGVSIVSLRAPGSFLDQSFPKQRVKKRYFKLSGTSMSAPIVSGMVAQLLQKNPQLTPKKVKNILRRHAQNLYEPSYVQGSGKPDMRKILRTVD